MTFEPKNIFKRRTSSILPQITALEQSTGAVFPPIYKAYCSEYKIEENEPSWLIINNEEELFSYLIFSTHDGIKRGFDTFNLPLNVPKLSNNSDSWTSKRRWPIGVTDSGETILLGTNTDEIDSILLEDPDSGKAVVVAQNLIHFISNLVYEVDSDILSSIENKIVYRELSSNKYKVMPQPT